MVHREAPVGVTVEGQAEVRRRREHRLLQVLGMGGATARVDVDAVRGRVDGGHRCPSRLEGRDGGLVGGAVGAVEDDGQACQGFRGPQRLHQVCDVGVDGMMLVNDAPHLVPDGPLPLLPHPVLDGVLQGIVELHAAAGEELDPVVGHVVVGCGDHHSEVGAVLAHEVGRSRRGNHPDTQHIDAGAGQPRTDRGLQELAGGAGVAGHQSGRLPPPEHPGLTESVGCRNRQVEGQFSSQFLIRDAAHAVGSEESSHAGKLRPCCGSHARLRCTGPGAAKTPPRIAGAFRCRSIRDGISAWSTAGPYGPS